MGVHASPFRTLETGRTATAGWYAGRPVAAGARLRTPPRADRVGENLARCFDSRQEAFDALVASPTHYAIMTGQFTNFGVSEVEDSASGCTYTTMHFAQYAQ